MMSCSDEGQGGVSSHDQGLNPLPFILADTLPSPPKRGRIMFLWVEPDSQAILYEVIYIIPSWSLVKINLLSSRLGSRVSLKAVYSTWNNLLSDSELIFAIFGIEGNNILNFNTSMADSYVSLYLTFLNRLVLECIFVATFWTCCLYKSILSKVIPKCQ